MKSELSSIN